jgi:hypothetical protein
MNTRMKPAAPMALVLAAALVLAPGAAHAYVDPGFLSSVYQFAYVAIFGVLAGVVFRPWNYIRNKFRKKSEDDAPGAERSDNEKQ